MKFNWVNYLDLAKILLANNVDSRDYSILTEAELRSAISRSYYAAFHVAKDYLYKTRCYIVPGSGVEGSSRDNPSRTNFHKFLIDEFKNSHDSDMITIGGYLENLRDRRNRADYDDILLDSKKRADEAIALSELILSELDLLASNLS